MRVNSGDTKIAERNRAEFGIGAYTPSEAGKLVGTSATNVRRWLFGYSYAHHGPKTAQAPLWQPQYGIDQDEPLLGFRDLNRAANEES